MTKGPHPSEAWGICPRCAKPRLRLDRPALNALSRTDNDTYVCSPCGSDEARRDIGGEAPVPPNEWPIEEANRGS